MERKEYIQKLSEKEISFLKFLRGKLLRGISSHSISLDTDGDRFALHYGIALSFLNEKETFTLSNEYDETEGFEDLYTPKLDLINESSSSENVYLSVTPTFFTIKSINIYGFDWGNIIDNNSIVEFISSENIFVLKSFDNRELLIHFEGLHNSTVIVSLFKIILM